MQQFQSETLQNKQSLRKACKKLRESLYLSGESDRISKAIVKNILKLDIFKDSKNILLFYPLKMEVNLLDLLKCDDKNFYFPKCQGDNLLVCPKSNEYKLNKYSIPEPESDPIDDLSILDIIFTPALCADKNLYRLGYGAGYYDRFFKDEKIRAKKVVPISEKFLCENLPRDKYDVPCDMLVFEDFIIQ